MIVQSLCSNQRFQSRFLFQDSLYAVGCENLLIKDVAINGIDTHPQGNDRAMYFDGGHNIQIQRVSCFGVARSILVGNGGWHGSDFRQMRVDGLDIRGWRSMGDNNRHEAVLFHGNAATPQQWIEDIRLKNVTVTDWPGSPLTLWCHNCRDIEITDWWSEAEGEVQIGLRPEDRIDDFVIRGGEWRNKMIRWFVFRGKYHSDQIGTIDLPPGWRHRVTYMHGAARREWGPFDFLNGVHVVLDNL
ncbi:MAG: hypothetical protein KatS3mg104_0910 [Phycisphaerae bacterium]|jgi:hypothetical protein|nr:MAG: hypothetical protein KatS3mg104_0910 [Phycisphaerae bacterium]